MIFSSLTISLGLYHLLMAAIAWWVLRTASVHLAVKVPVPVLLLILACSTWYTLPSAFGYPVETVFSALPSQAELIAFVPHDEVKTVDLWLINNDLICIRQIPSCLAELNTPRAYSVEMTEDLKDTLRKAQKVKADGGRAMLAKVEKPGGKKRPGYIDIDGGDAPYQLVPDAFTLPRKGGE